MQIDNKYNVGDTVYVFHYNKIQKTKINTIKITVDEDSIYFYYVCQITEDSIYNKNHGFQESLVYDSHESIVEHLTKVDNILNNILNE